MNKLFTFAAGIVLGIVLAGVAHTKAEHKLNDLEYANYKTLDYKIQIIEAYNEYYEVTENMLDSISVKYDWVDEAPSEYYDARDRLDYLWSLEDDDDPYVNKEDVINK
jgi:hypothetical protein